MKFITCVFENEIVHEYVVSYGYNIIMIDVKSTIASKISMVLV